MISKIKAIFLTCAFILCNSTFCFTFNLQDREDFLKSAEQLALEFPKDKKDKGILTDIEIFNIINARFQEITGITGFIPNDSSEKNYMQWIREITTIRLIVCKINKKNQKTKNLLAKETLHVILVNTDMNNAPYNFSQKEIGMIKTIKDTFKKHTKKHFSSGLANIPDGKFETEGRHSYITGLDQAIVIKNFVEGNTFKFLNDGTTLIERIQGGVSSCNNLGNVCIYSLHGAQGTEFSKKTAGPTLFEGKDGAYNIYFQLKLFVTGFNNFDLADGRFGSFYVTNN